MNELGKTLKTGWQSSGSKIVPPSNVDSLLAEAKKLNENSIKFQRNNLIILTLSFLMMCYFLLEYFNFQKILSKTGVAMMLGFFLLRISIEAYSIQKGKLYDITAATRNKLENERDYLQLRLKIHSTYTYFTLGFYTLGFLFLLPEFSLHLESFWMGALVVSYFIPGIILTLLIRKNVQKEIRELKAVVALTEKIIN